MATNRFIRPFDSRKDQTLYEGIIAESIRVHGADIYYLPRTNVDEDDLLNESKALFNDALMIDVYLKNTQSFEGQGNFLAKFGLEVRDQVTLTMSVRSFERHIAEHTTLVRPREGDYLYLPFIGAMYEIAFVDKTAMYFQLGALQSFDLTCELVEVSSEVFATGIGEIDDKYNTYSMDETEMALTDEDSEALTTEDGQFIIPDNPDATEPVFGENEMLDDESDGLLNRTESNPLGNP